MAREKTAEKKSDGTRAKIFEYALEFVRDIGVDQLTMRRLGEKADVSPALIIQYFGSKAQLLNLINDQKNLQMLEGLEERPFEGDSVQDVLFDVVDRLLEKDLAQPDLTMAVLAHSFQWERPDEEKFVSILSPFIDAMVLALRKAAPSLDEERARSGSTLLLMCYVQSARITLKRNMEKQAALDWMSGYISMIARGMLA